MSWDNKWKIHQKSKLEQTSKIFIVLGMHRSATSLIAKSLSQNNIDMGVEKIIRTYSNRWGHWENRDFVDLNNKILQIADGSWENPPPEPKILSVGNKLRKEIKKVIDKNSKFPMWGWKDPRTSLTIRCYMPYIINPHFIVCYRNPKEIAHSLYERDKIPIKRGVELAKIYNKRIQKFMNEWLEE